MTTEKEYEEVTVTYCYDVVTPESAEFGDYAEHGFYQDGRKYPIGGCETNPEDCYNVSDVGDPHHVILTEENLEELIQEIKKTCGAGHVNPPNFPGWPYEAQSSVSFYGEDSETDYSDGSETRYSAHIKGPPKAIAAVAKLLENA